MWQMHGKLLMDPQDIARLEEMLGYRFIDQNLLIQAMTHSSLANHRLDSNERLEFLGDAILGMVVCENLFRTFDQDLEGELTTRSASQECSRGIHRRPTFPVDAGADLP